MDAPLAYYNENDKFAAAWLVELISAGVIANGVVDTRDIQDVRADELEGYVQCHFFAGLGGWSYALRLAGWPDDRPVWTGSCPCQPYSSAGKGAGVSDPRHLWPQWFSLIRECKPHTLFGEQVSAAIGKGWLDLVQSDLEGEGYAVGAVVLGAASVGAPHIRQRLWFVGHSIGVGRQQQQDGIRRGAEGMEQAECKPIVTGEAGENIDFVAESNGRQRRQKREDAGRVGERSGAQRMGERFMRGGDEFVADAQPQRDGSWDAGEGWRFESSNRSDTGVLDNPSGPRRDSPVTKPESKARNETRVCGLEPGRADGRELGDSASREQWRTREPNQIIGREMSLGGSSPWSDCAWLPCRDGKLRPVERTAQSSLEQMVNGVPGDMGLVRLQNYPDHTDAETWIYAPLISKGRQRVGRLRGYGNAIVPQVAAEFISAYLEMTGDNL